MKKSASAFILIVILALLCQNCAWAHSTQNEHDKDLKCALFGDRDYTLQGDAQKAFRAIADAAALCIDQFSPNETSYWKSSEYSDLASRVGLSIPFEQIDLNPTKAIKGLSINANTHRLYTHKGWNYSEYPNKEFWKTRKQILTITVQRELFMSNMIPLWIPWLPDIIDGVQGSNEQVDAFSALVYYVHILGDHIEGNTPSKLATIDPLARYEDISSPGIIPELLEYLQILFPSQRYSHTFLSMQQDLDLLGANAEKNYYSWGGINTPEKCEENKKHAEKLLDILGQNLPQLLKEEDFFKTKFYSR